MKVLLSLPLLLAFITTASVFADAEARRPTPSLVAVAVAKNTATSKMDTMQSPGAQPDPLENVAPSSPQRPPRLPILLTKAPNASRPPAALLEVNFSWPMPPATPGTNPSRADLDTAVSFGLTTSISDMKSFGTGCQRTWSTPRSEAAFSGDDVFAPGFESYRFALQADAAGKVAPVPPIRLSAGWFMAAPPDARDLPVNVSVRVLVPATGVSTHGYLVVSTAERMEVCAAWNYHSRSNGGADVARLHVRFDGGEPTFGLAAVEELAPSAEPVLSAEPTPEPTPGEVGETDAETTTEADVFAPSEYNYSGPGSGGFAEPTEEEGESFSSEPHASSGPGEETVASPQPDLRYYSGTYALDDLPRVIITFSWLRKEWNMDSGVQASGDGVALCGEVVTGFIVRGRPKVVSVDNGMRQSQQYAVSLEKSVMAPGEAVLEIALFANWAGREMFSVALANVTVQYRAVGATASAVDGVPQTTTFNPVAERPGPALKGTPCRYNKIGKVRVTRDESGTVHTQTFVYARQTKV